MKSICLLVLIALICTGCLKYQYATINSPLKHDNSTSFIFENDTLKLSYDFSGVNGPVKISVYNKLNTPLYVDWSKSALIIGDHRISYWSKKSIIQANVNSSEVNWTKHISTSSGTVDGTITRDEALSFIPPKSSVTESQITLQNRLFKVPTPTKLNRKKVNYISVKSYSYNRETSPLVFRSFLTLSVTEKFESPQYFDDSFWVSEIFQTVTSPQQFIRTDDQFYISKPTGVGAFLGVATVTGLIVLVAAETDEQ